ncbi:MAG TPA: aminotransferase class I/II-fold pyridoxal phosphate-dependent enzyme [Bacillota bacterium]|nr:aminotransferase class I/II-fold pyridoxal phosphate-dependent enzyme [Bacillota bacterium]
MEELIFVQGNNRTFPKEDRIFSLNQRAKSRAAEKGPDRVVNSVIGALLSEDGNLVVFPSVVEQIAKLTPVDYAEYAPIIGTAPFRATVKKAILGEYIPKRMTEVAGSMGGTGAIRNAVANYSAPGDKILTSDWFWSPYNIITSELGRSMDTYRMFDEKGEFDLNSFEQKARELAESQGRLMVIINTPAHNPTGYSLNDRDWEGVKRVLAEITRDLRVRPVLLIDAAYMDFAGTQDEIRSFLPWLDDMPENVLPLIAYSASKGFTLYGMRCGALMCMSADEKVLEEFRRACEFSSRGTWSNGVRAAQTVIAGLYADPPALAKLEEEREHYREMLAERGRIFEKAIASYGKKCVPFRSGFFVCIETERAEELSRLLEEADIFAVPLKKGVRVSLASISREQCERVAKTISTTLDIMNE